MSILFRKIAGYENGARFYSGDLHIHSYGGSADVTDNSMTVEAIIDEAMIEGISLIAITDHNNDLNVLPALDYAAQYAGEILVIPGLEVTTAHGHLLLYFSPDQAELVGDLLGILRLEGKRGVQGTHTKKSMADVIGEADRLGGICVATHIDRPKTGFEMLSQSYPRLEKRHHYQSRTVFGLEFDDLVNLNWYSPADRTVGGERKVLLKARKQVQPVEGRFRLAPVQNSDAHTLV
ncbi:MAG: PHP domain-containing protein [bacterium]|nr:PHP domain-containing protein [bacterium]